MKKLPNNALLEAALALYGDAEVTEAKKLGLCLKAVERKPDQYRVLSWCAQTYMFQNQFDEAKRLFTKMIKYYRPTRRFRFGPMQDSSPLLELATIEEKQGHFDKAVRYIQHNELLDLNIPLSSALQTRLADDMFASGRFRAASDEYQIVMLKGDSLDPDVLRAKLVASLLFAGEKKRTLQLLAPLLSHASTKTVIRLQLALKERVAPHLELTGILDPPTLEILTNCAKKTCGAVTK